MSAPAGKYNLRSTRSSSSLRGDFSTRQSQSQSHSISTHSLASPQIPQLAQPKPDSAQPAAELGTAESFELEEATSRDSATSTLDSSYPPSRAAAPLAAPDHGLPAHLFLLGAFSVEVLIWSPPVSYGVFLRYYQQDLYLGQPGASLLPWVGSLASGMMYLLGPPVALLVNRRPWWKMSVIRTGAMMTVAALLLSSFANRPWQLLLTQGVMYSIGGSFVYYPTFSLLSEWFIARRGFANGACFAGTAAGGLVYPFIIEALVSKYSVATALRALALASFVLLLAALPLLKPRLPTARTTPSARRVGAGTPRTARRVWRSKRWWVYMVANTLQALGYFLPSLYLPTFASALGLSDTEGSAMLACVNASSVVSRLALGVMSDKMAPHPLGALAMLLSSLSVLLIWGLASTSLGPLLVFSLLLGLAAGGWTSLYSAIIRDTAKDDPELANMLFGMLSLTRGLGSILTAPLSSLLISHPLTGAGTWTGFGVHGGEYGSLVLFVGVALAVAAGIEAALFF